MKLSFDLYSMLFTTTMYSEYLYVIEDNKQKEEAAFDELVAQEEERSKIGKAEPGPVEDRP